MGFNGSYTTNKGWKPDEPKLVFKGHKFSSGITARDCLKPVAEKKCLSLFNILKMDEVTEQSSGPMQANVRQNLIRLIAARNPDRLSLSHLSE